VAHLLLVDTLGEDALDNLAEQLDVRVVREALAAVQQVVGPLGRPVGPIPTFLGLLESARAGNRCFWCLSALRAHTKAPYKTDLHRKTLRALNRPGGPGQVLVEELLDHLVIF
jgi:hypothetical protein